MSETVENADPILKVPEAAVYLGMSERFIREELKLGNMSGLRLGRFVRVRVSALEEYLDQSEL
jgi:excisionase family DNA binding protein